jgi:DNA polymerase (family 10)
MENLEILEGNLVLILKPFSNKFMFAGSIRRQKDSSLIHDIDIVLIPYSKSKLEELKEFARTKDKGNIGIGNDHISFKTSSGVEVDIFIASEDNFGAQLLTRTGSSSYNIGLRLVAKRKGLKLNEYGIFDSNGKCLASKTEEDIYKVLGKEWKLPELRGL